MMCLLDLRDGEVEGWIIGTDTYDLRRQVEGIRAGGDPTGELMRLASVLYGMDFLPAGKHRLSTGHWLLVC